MSTWISGLIGQFSVSLPLMALSAAFPMLALAAPLAVVSKEDSVLQLFDTRTGLLRQEYPLGFLPHEVVISRLGKFIAVTNYGKDHVRSQAPTNKPGRTLTLILGPEKTDIATYDLDAHACAPHGIVENWNGERLYITCEEQQKIIVFDVPGRKVLRSFSTGQMQSHMVVISEDETRAYTSNFASGTVTAIDLRSGEILAQIPVGPGTEGLSISSDGKTVYASSVLGGFIAKIDADTLKVTATAKTPRSPVRIVPTPDGRRLLVNSSAEGRLIAYRESDLREEWSLNVGRQPIGLAVSNARTAYVAVMLEHQIVQVDLHTAQIVKRFPSAQKPDGISVFPE